MAVPSRLETLQTLRASLYDVAFSTAFGTLLGGAFMVGFIRSCNGGDVWIGLIAAIGSLLGVLQIPGAIWGRRFSEYKRFVWPGGLTWRLLYIPVAFLPILALSGSTKLVIATVLIILASAAVQVVNPIYTDWLAEIVPSSTRGAFFTKRNAIATGTGSILGIIGGVILDHFKAIQDENLGLSLIFGLGAICGLISFYYFWRMKEQPRPHPIREPLLDGIKAVSHPFKNKNYRPILAYLAFGVFARTFPQPFFAAYALETLKLPFSVITVCGAMQSLSIILFSPMVGFFSDKYGNKPILIIGGVFVAMNPLLWVLARDGAIVFNTVYLLICHLFFGIAWAIIGPGQGNLMMNTAPKADRANYLGAGSAVTAIVAGISPLFGSFLMVWLRNRGTAGEAYRVLFLLSSVLRIVAIFFIFFVHEEGSSGIRKTISQIAQARPRSMSAARKLDQPGTPAEKEAMIAVLTEKPSVLAVQGLVRLLGDPLPKVRRSAAIALSKLKSAEVQTELVSALIQHIKNNPDLVEEESLDALAGFGEYENPSKVVETLAELLHSPRGPIRRAAAHALGRLEISDAVFPLCDAVRNGDPDTRRAALQALRILRAPEAIPTMIESLQDESASVATAAAEAVGELEITEATPVLRTILVNVLGAGAQTESEIKTVESRSWHAVAYALGCVGNADDLALILQIGQKCRNAQSRQTVLLGAAHLLNCESEVYRVLVTRGLDRESSLLALYRGLMRKNPEVQQILVQYSEMSQDLNTEPSLAEFNANSAIFKLFNLENEPICQAILKFPVKESFIISSAWLTKKK